MTVEESVKPAEFVRWVSPGFDLLELVNELKSRFWVDGAEHSLLRLASGELVLVKGGWGGILFDVEGGPGDQTLGMQIDGIKVRIVELILHTHPRVTGPSDSDRNALAILRQLSSIVYEIGGDPDGTRFTAKPDSPTS